MRVVTWNVNSLKARSAYVERYLDAVRPDVVAMQELKLEDDKVPREIFTSRGYHLETHGQKQYNGVAIASLLPLSDVHCGLEGGDDGQSRLIAATLDGPDGEKIDLINLYCPQGSTADSPKFQYKLAFYDALIAWLESLGDLSRTLVVGDLNIAPDDRDIWDPIGLAGVPSFHPAEHERWAALCELGLVDVVEARVAPGSYSFWDYRGAAFRLNEGMRIDHVLAGEDLVDAVHDAGIDRPWRKKQDALAASDHAPVWVDLR